MKIKMGMMYENCRCCFVTQTFCCSGFSTANKIKSEVQGGTAHDRSFKVLPISDTYVTSTNVQH